MPKLRNELLQDFDITHKNSCKYSTNFERPLLPLIGCLQKGLPKITSVFASLLIRLAP